MDIITFSESLQKQLKDLNVSDENDLVSMGKSLTRIREVLSELKHFTLAYTFQNESEQIKFFKEVKPVLLSQYFYYKKIFEVHLLDSFRDQKSRIENYYAVLQKMQRYAYKNQSFYEYCMSGATYLDNQYFICGNIQHVRTDQDEKFTTGYDHKLAKILAHELIKQFIIVQIKSFEKNKTEVSTNQMQWTSSKVALIELVYALHASGTFNFGKTDVKQIVNCFEEVFSISLGNYARVFAEIRIRKSGQTNFLDSLTTRLSEYIDDIS
jgi:hypothetical protein